MTNLEGRAKRTEPMAWLGRCGVPIVCACLLAGGAMAQEKRRAGDGYALGPEDKLRVKVYDWRKDMGDVHEWTALTGEFTVGASGNVFMPLVGEIPALNRTSSDLANDIAVRLQKRFGLADLPDAAVEVATYRPFYILGIVDKAGAYPYRPGLTVQQAVGLAGGVSRLRDLNLLGYERDALATRGQLRILAVQRVTLMARQARFDAEIKEAPSVVFPGELLALAADPDAARAMREEQALFANARDSLAKQIESLNRTTDLLQHEVVTLSSKDSSLSRQVDLASKELDTVATLVTKGLTIVPRQLAIQQTVSQFESSRLDVQLAMLRAREDMARVDREILELHRSRLATALAEARDVMSKLADVNAQIETDQMLVYQAEVRAPRVILAERDAARRSFAYRITRTRNGIAAVSEAGENDSVQPGDTIDVEPNAGPEVVSDRR